MITRNDLSVYLQDYLDIDAYQDFAPNGLQVEGKQDISVVCTAVTASEGVIEQAESLGADALIVHHGYFWRGESPLLTGMKKRRIQRLLSLDMNLFAYHLPLDCHDDIGNNACIAKLIGVKEVVKHRAGNTLNLLWSGQLPEPTSTKAFSLNLTRILKRSPLVIEASDAPISRVAWCTGAAQDFIDIAHQLGVDAYISGEISERTYYQALEMGIHYFACGHHSSERFGIQALGQHLVKQFSLKHHFIDSANPV